MQADEWKLENSMVMDIQNDPRTGAVWWDRGHAVTLCGHGMPPEPYGSYSESMARRAQAALSALQDRVDQEIFSKNSNSNPSDDIPLDGSPQVIMGLNYPDGRVRARIIRWSPYEPFPGIGAWWIEIPESEMEFRFKVSTAIAALPFLPYGLVETFEDGKRYLNMAVEVDPVLGQWSVQKLEMIEGYRTVPGATSLYFPLHLPIPRTGQGWNGYVTARIAGDITTPQLSETQIDARLIPGFMYFGEYRDTNVIRPRARPAVPR